MLFLFMLTVVGLYKLSRARTFQMWGEIVPRVNTPEKMVALTFDDGPSPETDTILAMLRGLEVKATFFIIGKDLEKYSEEGKKIVAAGHELGNHSYSHQRMVFKSMSFVQQEIEKTDSLIRSLGYTGEIHFRAPFGKKLFILSYYLSQQQRKNIMWDVEPESYAELAESSEKMTLHVLENTQPGSIILLHVMEAKRKESRQAIPGIVVGLKQQGYRFLTVSELLQQNKTKTPHKN